MSLIGIEIDAFYQDCSGCAAKPSRLLVRAVGIANPFVAGKPGGSFASRRHAGGFHQRLLGGANHVGLSSQQHQSGQRKTKGTITGNGADQTIAIVDAYNDPNIVSDLATFDAKFGLAAANLTVVSQTGSTTKLPADQLRLGLGNFIGRRVGPRHRPRGEYLLVEANSASLSDLLTAVKYAAQVTRACRWCR